MLYNLINKNTKKIVGYTIVTSSDSDWASNDEILDTRLEAAIADGFIEDDDLVWVKSKRKFGKCL